MEIGRAARTKGAQRTEKLSKAYGNLPNAMSRVVGRAKCITLLRGHGL